MYASEERLLIDFYNDDTTYTWRVTYSACPARDGYDVTIRCPFRTLFHNIKNHQTGGSRVIAIKQITL